MTRRASCGHPAWQVTLTEWLTCPTAGCRWVPGAQAGRRQGGGIQVNQINQAPPLQQDHAASLQCPVNERSCPFTDTGPYPA